jgi:glutathione S-transferase
MTSIKIYGVPFSQPVRSVIWLLLLKEQLFQLVPTNPGLKGENGSRHPSYLKKNPSGTIPCLEECDTGYTLGEGHAIMAYLSQKQGWNDMYPDDLRARGKVDWYLNFHHRNIRDASGMVAPKIRKDLDIPELVQESAKRKFTLGLKTLDEFQLARGRFIAADHLTIADLSAYGEIGQLQPQFTNLFDFESFPNVQRWLADMQNVRFHDEAHVVLSELGDISQEAPSMDTIRSANIDSISVLANTVKTFSKALSE